MATSTILPELSSVQSLRRVTVVCSSITAGLGLLTILGWLSGLTVLASMRANYIPMAPSTGVAFMLFGAMLVLTVTVPSRKLVRMSIRLITLLVILLGILKLGEFFLGVSIGFDVETIMVRHPGMFGAVPLARMSPITAATFVLSGLSLLLVLSESQRNQAHGNVAGALGLLVLLIGFTVLLGYLYHEPLLYFSSIIPVALPTAAGFMCVGLGLVATAGRQHFPLRSLYGSSARARLLRAFLPITIAPVLMYGSFFKIILTWFPLNVTLLSVLGALVLAVIISVAVYYIGQTIGGAIDYAELILHESHDQLELRIYERTAALARSNTALQDEIVERKRLETEAHQAGLVAETANRAKSDFLANMSHELRTPLNAILGLSEALQEQIYGGLNPQQFKMVHTIEESGQHLLALINDILDLSKIEAGKVDMQITSVAAEAICQASLRLIKQAAQQKQLTVSLTFDRAVLTLQADERSLKQILVNLFSNAIKFTPTGGAIGLDVVGDTRAHLVRFTVWDTGVGISQENQARVFEPFIQVDSGLARESAGTGLGLALVKRMIELHGGSIAVASEPEAGSRFIATLPWHQSDATTTMTRNTSLNERGDAPSQASRAMPALILLAEDNEINSMMMSDYLEVKGYRVIIARNGNEAIIQAHSTRPDMILMDIQMPGMDGLSAIRHLRADADLAPIPIIALTALAMLDDKERCFAAGATAYLSKPVNLKNLIAVLAAHLPQSQGAA